MDDTERVGERIAASRKSLDLTQQQLATLAGVSKSMLAKVEAGHASASNAWIGSVARALGVDLAYLTGGPNVGAPASAHVHRFIPRIRRMLATWDLVEPADESENWPVRAQLDDLAADVAALAKARHDTAYDKIGSAVPVVVSSLSRVALRATEDADRERAYAMLTMAYRAANTMCHKLGYPDLSLTALERMEWAAARSGDQLLSVMVDYIRAGALSRIGGQDAAVQLLNRGIATVAPLASNDESARHVLGCLHMKLIVIYGTMADVDLAQTHLVEATRLAAEAGQDATLYDTPFGPTNVKLHELSARIDLHQPDEALATARDTQPPDRNMPRERRTYFYTDLARAHLLAGNADEAVEALYEARAVAPLHFANSTSVRNTIYSLASQQRRATSGLRALANSVGIRD